MRYWTLALAILFAGMFLALQVHPQAPTELAFLSAKILLPIAAYAQLSFLLGTLTGIFGTVSVAAWSRRRASVVPASNREEVRA